MPLWFAHRKTSDIMQPKRMEFEPTSKLQQQTAGVLLSSTEIWSAKLGKCRIWYVCPQCSYAVDVSCQRAPARSADVPLRIHKFCRFSSTTWSWPKHWRVFFFVFTAMMKSSTSHVWAQSVQARCTPSCENGQKPSDGTASITSLVPGVKHLRLQNGLEFDRTY